jgi:hypothetical protein
LPLWIFKGEPKELTVYRPRLSRPGQRPATSIQIGLLNDALTLDGQTFAPDLFFDYRLEPDGLCYLNHYLPELAIEKRVRQTPEGLVTRYTFANQSPAARHLSLQSFHELNPDYREVLDWGRAALDFHMHEGLYPGVINTVTKQALAFEPSMEWKKLEHGAGLLALTLGLTFELSLSPKEEKTLEVKLNVCEAGVQRLVQVAQKVPGS